MSAENELELNSSMSDNESDQLPQAQQQESIDEEETTTIESNLPIDSTNQVPINRQFEGTLSKWTNFIHGWQERFMVLREGTLSYYKSKNETDIGCRGAISIQKAAVKVISSSSFSLFCSNFFVFKQVFQYDDCRFDVSVGDCVWYLRGRCKDERDNWVEALEAQIVSYFFSLIQSKVKAKRKPKPTPKSFALLL